MNAHLVGPVLHNQPVPAGFTPSTWRFTFSGGPVQVADQYNSTPTADAVGLPSGSYNVTMQRWSLQGSGIGAIATGVINIPSTGADEADPNTPIAVTYS